MCGGTSAIEVLEPEGQGLSPRVRGNPRRPGVPPQRPGSIPACAGEPPPVLARVPASRVYPRVCGGTTPVAGTVPRVDGLSPRVRGNPLRRRAVGWGRGSIPACAGEPPPRRRAGASARVYPRVCGGTLTTESLRAAGTGLSPRVRGNLRSALAASVANRSIPACAGEPSRAGGARRTPRVYPRVCGGTQRSPPRWPAFPGLSPRVRGNLGHPELQRDGEGSIPACAGEPSQSPRARSIRGLSPRVRGNRGTCSEARLRTGSIPACAGEPVLKSSLSNPDRVYPRVCGGTAVTGGEICNAGGLSPRVRGNRWDRCFGCVVVGSIPACAGEPDHEGCG